MSFQPPMRHRDTLQEGATIALDRDHVRALDARAIKVKEAFTIVDATGAFFRASLKEKRKASAVALVYERMGGSTESPAQITLLCAVLARQRMMTVVQKATELGVARIVPVLTQHSVQREGLEHQKAHAWPKQVLRAARQCRRASVPDLRAACGLQDALEDPSFIDAQLRVYLDDRVQDAEGLRSPTETTKRIVFAVGPEGGWSEPERELLQARGAQPLRLGGRVVRAETAVLAGLVVLQRRFGDL